MHSKDVTYTEQGPQGDVLFTRLDKVPDLTSCRRVDGGGGAVVVAHSETGHHHTVDPSDVVLYESGDPLIAYLVPAESAAGPIVVTHHRGYDRHGAATLIGGPAWEVTRQREYDPAGERRASD